MSVILRSRRRSIVRAAYRECLRLGSAEAPGTMLAARQATNWPDLQLVERKKKKEKETEQPHSRVEVLRVADTPRGVSLVGEGCP